MKRSKKILIYKLCCIVFAAVLLFLPDRGYPHADIRVLATVLGVDGGEGKVEVAVQLAIPVAQTGDGKASTVAKATGGSICEAMENLEFGLGRSIDYGHLSTVAIGKDVTLSSLFDFVWYLMSSDKAGSGTYLVYCSSSPAVEFIAEAQKLGESSDAELDSFIAYSKTGNHVATTTMLKFMQTLNSTSHAAFLPCVSLENENSQPDTGNNGTGSGLNSKSEERQEAAKENKDKTDSRQSEQGSKEKTGEGESGGSGGEQESGGGSGGQQEGGGSGGGGQESGGGSGQQESGGSSGGGQSEEKKKLVAADSVAVYGGDGNEPMVLDSIVTRGIVWQDTASTKGLIELRNIQLDGQDVTSVPAKLTKKTVKKTATVINGENVFTYKITARLRLNDSRICGSPLFYDKLKKTLEELFESVIKSNLLLAVNASKESNIDFLGLRESFHKYCKKGYENFDLAKVVVNADVKVTIQT